MKNNLSLVSAGQMKRLVNASKPFVIMVIKPKEKDVFNSLGGCDLSHNHKLLEIISNYDGVFQEPKGFPPNGEIENEICL